MLRSVKEQYAPWQLGPISDLLFWTTMHEPTLACADFEFHYIVLLSKNKQSLIESFVVTQYSPGSL